jgi:LuxR family transcriptional activator of conjugal transfer of Ti plasmids
MACGAAFALADCCDSLQAVTTVGGFREALGAAARQLGFQWFAYLRISEGSPELISSYPSPFTKRYTDLHFSDEDPIVRHARLVNGPFSWSDIEDADFHYNPNDRVTKEAVKCGIRSGITIPIHSGYNKFAALSFAGPTIDGPPRYMRTNIAAIQLMAVQFHVHFTHRVAGRTALCDSLLTQRQRECLKWSARGKTMSEIGTILGITERTVLFHLHDARQRLDAQTITQAVATAIRLNQIPES